MSDMSDYPIIQLSGSGRWSAAYETGEALDVLFPGQDAEDFALALEYNDYGPCGSGDDFSIAGLLMLVQGMNDEGDWMWLVRLPDGSHHVCVAGCDYTGWDCRSGLNWYTWDEFVADPENVSSY